LNKVRSPAPARSALARFPAETTLPQQQLWGAGHVAGLHGRYLHSRAQILTRSRSSHITRGGRGSRLNQRRIRLLAFACGTTPFASAGAGAACGTTCFAARRGVCNPTSAAAGAVEAAMNGEVATDALAMGDAGMHRHARLGAHLFAAAARHDARAEPSTSSIAALFRARAEVPPPRARCLGTLAGQRRCRRHHFRRLTAATPFRQPTSLADGLRSGIVGLGPAT